MARPLSEMAKAALSALEGGPLMARDLSVALQIPERTIKDICYRLVGGGHARIAGKHASSHARRPVALYALPSSGNAALMNSVWHR